MKRIITAKVKNQSGVLNRITGLLQRRQFNIESISVGRTENEDMSRITFVVDVEDFQKLEQVTKQLNKQIDVIKVSDITDRAIVTRELALIKIQSNPQLRTEIQGIIDPFRATVIDVSRDTMSIQVTGKQDKIEALIELLRPYGVKDIARTGITALLRGQQSSGADPAPFSILN